MIRRYYSGVQRGDEIINVRDSVLLKSGTRKKDPPFVARVSGLWEEDEGKPVVLQLLVCRAAKDTYCISYKCKFVFICQTNSGKWC